MDKEAIPWAFEAPAVDQFQPLDDEDLEPWEGPHEGYESRRKNKKA